MDERLHILGIRHHGPGSAASVEQALDALNPDAVLIEGPVEASELIAFAGDAGMQPPVALLLYPKGCPEAARFFPFAEFSPEWRAMLWATRNHKSVEFIDLPTQQRAEEDPATELDEQQEDEEPDANGDFPADYETGLKADPLNELARVAGHSDGESWWSALVEQSVQSPAVFDAINAVMAAVRERFATDQDHSAQETEREAQREAHMRLRIRDALKKHEGNIAVVCGAWHAPALQQLQTIKTDKAILKSTKAVNCECCWIPWTDQRLAASSGYGAGVISPGWYRHLWQQHQARDTQQTDAALWQARVATLLRDEGFDASTASVIEAARLTRSLTAVRGLSTPGLAELQDASLSALCHGDVAPLQIIHARLVIGNTVGTVAGSAPQPPLLADLAKRQKTLRLKPEALARDVRLDLRTVSGMAKSELLHRLILLDVHWGQPGTAATGRGTFTEVWTLQWQPEHAVALAEATVYGPTLDMAAAASAVAKAADMDSAESLAGLVRSCLLANLPDAVQLAVQRLQAIAATAVEVTALMAVLPPLADVKRYGTARELPTGELDALIECMAMEIVSGYRYACHQLDDDTAAEVRKLTRRFDRALGLLDEVVITRLWHSALKEVTTDDRTSPLLRGLAARLLHNQQVVDPGETALTLSRNLAPAVPALEAGAWLEGFIDESGEVFIHDDELFVIVDQWLQSIDEDLFIEILPMVRRSFSEFDPVLRRRMLQRVASQPVTATRVELANAEDSPGAVAFLEFLPLLDQLLDIKHE